MFVLSVVPECCGTRGGDSRLSEEKHLLHLWATAQVPHRFSQGGGAEAGTVVRLWHALSRQDIWLIAPDFSNKMSAPIFSFTSTEGFFFLCLSDLTSILTLSFLTFRDYYSLKPYFMCLWGEIHHLLESVIKLRLKVLLELDSWDKVHPNVCADDVALCVCVCVSSGFAYLDRVLHRDKPLLLRSGKESCLSKMKCFTDLYGIHKLPKCSIFKNLLNESRNGSY